TDGDGEPVAGSPQRPYSTVFRASVPNPAYIDGWLLGGDYTVSNPYAGSYVSSTRIVRSEELPSSFRRASAGSEGGYDLGGQLFVTSRLDGFDYEDAHALIDRAVLADGSFPEAEILCMRSADEARGAR